ncbi:uncharacterized protein LOC135085428 [Ostrinia nubilalis]|uniref:uncharacterized protein LOC135085428 n=1 Tax=Ostrinia nubilalis TaxID=29057 RepID=UPI003082588E
MALPALRQPKKVIREKPKILLDDVQNVILTLKDKKSLVVSSDAYHGILRGREVYRCVFCSKDIELDVKIKEWHKDSEKHRKVLEGYPHDDGFGENLVRKLAEDLYYCTLCRVIVPAPFITRHIMTEAHTSEMDKAIAKVFAHRLGDK